ncbi:MAG TPA: PIN domain-containing protein [Candidatus Deferrimicrobiaceae bacterium]|nr:PIN domain-containing protein [Candidatus Deferrimicrobiaceae bacterium]
MMSDRHLYDTRFFFEYFYSQDATFVRKLKQEAKSTKEKFVSVLTIHELHHISMKRSGKEVAALRSHTIFTEFRVVDVDYAIAVKSAELRNIHKMPMADSVIAATAQVHGCTLLSDDAHFRGIPNLKTKWYN